MTHQFFLLLEKTEVLETLLKKDSVKLKFNNYEIKEFPMSTSSFLGTRFTSTGGGYFRFFPYFVIRSLVQTSQYTMTYFHPRDFDEDVS